MIYLFTINYQNVFAFVLIVCLKYFSIIQRKEELLFKHCKQFFSQIVMSASNYSKASQYLQYKF